MKLTYSSCTQRKSTIRVSESRFHSIGFQIRDSFSTLSYSKMCCKGAQNGTTMKEATPLL